MSPDQKAVLYSLAYVLAMVALGEVLHRFVRLPQAVTRKVVHVGAGLWVFPTLALFQSRWWALLPPLLAVGANWAALRWHLAPSMAGEGRSYGTVYFPLAFAILLGAAWDTPVAITAGLVAMTLGDPAAALAGRRWPAGPYGGKSLTGSAAMFAVSLLALLATLVGWHGLSLPHAWPLATVLAAAAALGEAAGRRGADNLTVPLLAGGLAWALAAYRVPPAAVQALALGVWLSLAIGLAGYLRRSLAETGLLGAVLVGTLTFGLGGWGPGAALVFFFASSSLWSRQFARHGAAAATGYAKGSRRDLGQALANGGVAAALCVAGAATDRPELLAAAVGALAAACADTWATEWGALSPGPPRLVTTWRSVPAGTSGGVSLVGTAAAAGGALATAAVGLGALALSGGAMPAPGGRWLLAVAAGGLAGSLLDSLLGATVQGIYRCAACGRETERAAHCGRPAALLRGWRPVGNDLVNTVATAAGAGLTYLFLG